MGLKSIRCIAFVLAIILTHGCSTANAPKSAAQENNIDLLVLEGNADTAYKSGHLELAEGLYRQLLSYKKDYAPAWFRLGNIYTRTNRLDAAVNAYQNSISSDNEHAKAWHNLAIARVRQATDVLIEAQNHLVVDTAAKDRMDQLFLELMRIQSAKNQGPKVASYENL